MAANSTIFILKGCNPADFSSRVSTFSTPTQKNKYDVIQPGKSLMVNNAGGVIRVLQRGELYDKDGNVYNGECGKACWWHRHPFEGRAMGIPIRVINTACSRKIYMDGIFCSYECALAYLEDELSKIVSKRNPNFAKSRPLLFQLFADEFPGEDLQAAPDWRLLKDVGNGNLSLKEFLVLLKGIRLTEHPNYTFHAVTVNYEIINQKL